MTHNARILFVVPANEQCNLFAQTLKNGMPDRDITITSAGLTATLFEMRKYDVVHIFSTGSGRKFSGKNRIIHTIVGQPEKPERYRSFLGSHVVTFSQAAKSAMQTHAPGIPVEVIPPCTMLADPVSLEPPSELRREFAVGERMLVVALSDVSSRKEFDAFLYVAREYNRREMFRFLIPRYKTDRETSLWRKRLQNSIELERLGSTTLLEDTLRLHSWIDSSDFCVFFNREPEREFEFPLHVLEAMLRGKPVLSFNLPPVNEYVRETGASLVCNNIEDVARESKEFLRMLGQMEERSTEVARYARSRFGTDTVAAQYKDLYNRVLGQS